MPTPLNEIGPVYSEMAKMGFTPRQVDEMEFWEVAKILGVEDQPKDPVYARIKAMKGKGKMPEARPVDPTKIGKP